MDDLRQLGSERPRIVALVSRFDEAEEMGRIAARAGATLSAALVIDPVLAASPLDQPADAWLVNGTEPALAGPLSVVLDTLNGKARESGVPVLARVVPELVDLAWARLPEHSTAILCDPTPADQVATLAVALRQPEGTGGVSDSRAERDVSQLRKLSEDVDRIARVLATLTAEQEAPESRPLALEEGAGPVIDVEGAVRLIRAAVRARRLRERFFPGDLFADPAWDMLLDLMAARLERKRVAVSSLCIAAAVPATTALRYLKTMTGAGLFVRRPDAADGRRVFIELSDAAAEAMNRYLGQLREIFAPALG